MKYSGQSPKVSILIPVYNRERYIGDCIQSATAQTCTDFEIVIVDNASTDRTWEICQSIAATDKRMRIYRNETNIGPVRNWLRCVSQSRGEYGKILFSDDLMSPRFLELTLPYFEDPEVGFVSTAALVGPVPGHGRIMYSNSDKELYLLRDRYFELMIRARVPYSPGSAIFRIADIHANLQASFPTRVPRDFTINGAGPDIMLYALTALNYKKVVMLPNAEVFFRHHNDSITVANSDNEVVKGYQSALAWFCRTKLVKSHWANFMAHAWWAEAKRNHRLKSIYAHCIAHEGDGSIAELFLVMQLAIRVVIHDIQRKIYQNLGKTKRLFIL